MDEDSVDFDADALALLTEAMTLLGASDPSAVVRTALKELVERQRFLRWVAQHEQDPRGQA